MKTGGGVKAILTMSKYKQIFFLRAGIHLFVLAGFCGELSMSLYAVSENVL